MSSLKTSSWVKVTFLFLQCMHFVDYSFLYFQTAGFTVQCRAAGELAAPAKATENLYVEANVGSCGREEALLATRELYFPPPN